VPIVIILYLVILWGGGGRDVRREVGGEDVRGSRGRYGDMELRYFFNIVHN